jgi:hypothetical protein
MREEHARLLGSDEALGHTHNQFSAGLGVSAQSAEYSRPAPAAKKTRAIVNYGDSVCASCMQK